MKTRYLKWLSFLGIWVFLFFGIASFTAFAEEDLPTTGFEDRDGQEWTTFEEEQEFLSEVEELSERVTVEQIGESVEGRPLHLIKVGYPSPPSDEDIASGRNIFIMGTQHGNEPSGREMSLKIMRDLAFTDDPEMLELISKSTILIVPTVNPDGREADRRISSDGVDLNRDQITLKTPEGQTIASVMDQYQPDLTLDAHERVEGPNISLLGSTNLNVYDGLIEINNELINDYMMPEVEAKGFTVGPYPGGGAPRTVRNVTGLRHSIGVLVEATWVDDYITRVEGQMASVESVLNFYNERFDEIGQVVEEARIHKENVGSNQSEPYYLEGDIDEYPPEYDILDPPPFGYLINNDQDEKISTQIDLFSIQTEQVSENGVFVPMGQPMMTVIPFIMDENSNYRLIEGKALYDPDVDPGSIDPPLPPESVELNTDFSQNEEGVPPSNWSTSWRESNWKVFHNPSRLQHYVDEDGGRRVLTWDDIGDVRGDVEVAGLVRARGGNSTMFQMHMHVSGDAGNESSYYLDLRGQGAGSTANHVRINRNIDSRFKVLETEPLPFTVEENSWYHVVFQREGEVLRGKVWPYGESEPDRWSISVEDRFIDYGKVGVGHVSSGMLNEWAYFSVGTANASATRAPEDLIPDVDKTLLQARLMEINEEELDSSNYTEESWNSLQEAIQQAENILDEPEVTQEDVDESLDTLNNAYSGLVSAPAQYRTNFSHYNVGGAPEDWTSYWNESQWTVLDNPSRLEHDVASGGRSALAWDQVGEVRGKVEVAALVKPTGSGTTLFQLPLHISGSQGSENSYYLDLRTTGSVRINRNLNSSFNVLQTSQVPYTVTDDTWYHAVLQRDGDTLRGKVWPFGETEPVEWQVEVVDDAHSFGRVGLSHVTSSRVNDWAFFGVGVGGQEAPRATDYIFEPVSVDYVEENILTFVESGELKAPLDKLLLKRLEQASRQYEKDHVDQAIKKLEDLLKHLNDEDLQDYVDSNAKSEIDMMVNELIFRWEKN